MKSLIVALAALALLATVAEAQRAPVCTSTTLPNGQVVTQCW